jgi:hypothetical protein
VSTHPAFCARAISTADGNVALWSPYGGLPKMTTLFRGLHARASAILGAVLISGIVAAPAVAQPSGSLVPSLSLSGSNATASAASEALAPPAQDPAAKQDSATMNVFRNIEVSGFVDMYYTYNFNKPQNACATVAGVAVFNCLHNFDFTHNSFSLSLAEVALEKKPTADSRGGFRIDLDYGPTTTWVHGAEPGGVQIYQNIQQAYVSYLAPTAKGSLQFDFGKFVTQHGAEVIETKDNWNYSRSLLFAWAIPYYHTGVRATYTVNDKVMLMGDLVNGWNNVTDNNTGKTVGAQAMYKPISGLSIIANYMGGPEQNNDNDNWRHLFDVTATYAPTPKLSLMANVDYGKDTVSEANVKWHGVGGYLKYQPNSWFALVPRYEHYSDPDGFTTGVSQTVQEVTLTGELKHKDGVMMRIEYRRDFSDVAFFLKRAAERVKNQDTFTIGFVYAFSTKAQ